MSAVAVDADATFLAEICRVADDVASKHAADVDADARFPQETIDALRELRALSCTIPTELGGGGVSFEALAQACFELGRRCSSSGMVFAMHMIEVVTIQRHPDTGTWYDDYLRRVAAEQRLIASITSEIGNGGDMSRSIAPVEADGDRLRAVKQAPTVSYGAHADDYFTTLRRSPESAEGDQVLVLHHGDDTVLEQNGTWDPMGMRGTVSAGFTATATFAPDQVFPHPFSTVMAESMVPVSHILWSHLWLGIATDAFDRARAFVRAAARRKPGEPLPAAQRLSHLATKLSLLRAEVENGLATFVQADREKLSTMSSIVRFNNLKIAASEQSVVVCQDAMRVCGIMGYKNDTPFSVGRHLRDSMSGSLMVTNDRLHDVNANLLLVARDR